MVLGLIGSLIGSVVGWVVGLFVGGLALFLAAGIVVGEDHTLGHGLVTALLGAIVWGLLAWIPGLGWILAPLGWISVINWRYSGGWGQAIVVAIAAWIVSLVVLFVLGLVGLGGLSAVGIPTL